MSKKLLPVQFGISATADFEENTWTFEMPEKYAVAAGEFAIVDRPLYDELFTLVFAFSEMQISSTHGINKINSLIAKSREAIAKAKGESHE